MSPVVGPYPDAVPSPPRFSRGRPFQSMPRQVTTGTAVEAGRPTALLGSAACPYRHLAVRVIDQALRDLANPTGLAADRQSAQAFLSGSSMLRHWCEVARLDPARIVARVAELAAEGVPAASTELELGPANATARAVHGMRKWSDRLLCV